MADDRRGRSAPGATHGPTPGHMGLLDYVTATSLDADYAEVARRREAAGSSGRPPKGHRGRLTVVALAVFGVLVATAAVQTSRDARSSAASRESLVKQADARKAALNQRRKLVRDLQAQIAVLQASSLEATTEGRAVAEQLSRLGVLTGSEPTRGPGIQVHVDDAPGATTPERQVQSQDLQKLVNALWTVGAEAIAINGQRLTSLSPIRDAAGSVTVNFRSISRPYTVSAIGSSRQMGAQLLDTAGGRAWVTLQSNFGLQFTIDTKDSMELPAATRLALRHAHQPRDH
jgi:uncharacterized protein YlxW (UPF0749 family)